MIDSDYTITEHEPLAEEYLAIRAAVRWDNPPAEVASSALDASLLCVCVRYKDELVGFGRVIGDGHFTFYIQDIIVHPDHQCKGLGKAIMERIMSYIDAAGGQDAQVGLMAAKGVIGFYEQFGFSVRPAEMPGMCRWPVYR